MKLQAVLVICAWLGVVPTPRPRAPVALVYPAPAGTVDSVAIVLRWGAVLDAKGNPVARYLWSIRSSSPQNATLGADSTTRLADTLVIARPGPGDSVMVYGAVAARDSKGTLGGYGVTGALKVPGKPWTPPAAPAPTVDTLAFRADSAKLVIEGHTLNSLGQYVLVGGDTVDACAYSWRNGTLSPGKIVTGWTSSDPTLAWPVGPSPLGTHCERFATSRVAAGLLQQLRRWGESAWKLVS